MEAQLAEAFAMPREGELAPSFARTNDVGEVFQLRWGAIRFDVRWGPELNIKVLLKVYREGGVCEHFMVDTEPRDESASSHRRVTRDFFVHPFPATLGRVTCVKFAFIAHLRGRSIPSELEYIFMDREHFDRDTREVRPVTALFATSNTWRTYEADAELLQRDVDWLNGHPETLGAVPKFTKGTPYHPYHPKRYVHDQLDAVIRAKQAEPGRMHTVKVCIDCIDDADFVNHLIHAAGSGVLVQCQVDWRKMVLTNSEAYARLKRSGVELLGVFCTPRDPRIEVDPDMHNKFIIFGDSDAILGSFNITFDRWGANWESGMTFRSQGVCRLLDNVFQSIRGGVIRGYGVDPLSPFNLLYTFGQQRIAGGKLYLPHQAILSEIHRARRSIVLCLFLVGELKGEHDDSVVDALIHAHGRGCEVLLVVNGHVARVGDPGQPRAMRDELLRPLLPALARIQRAGVPILQAYGQHERPVPYSPIHSKYCVLDSHKVVEGSFNWYNTSVFSHDLCVVLANQAVALAYEGELFQTIRELRIFR